MPYPRRVAQQLTDAPFSERLTVPWWTWPAGLALAAFASAEIFLGASPEINWIPYAILIPLTIVGLLRLGRVRVRVDPIDSTAPELRVDDAHIPVSFVTEVNVIDAATKRELLGPLAAPHVFVVERPWIGGAVRVAIDDPADPTPYWVISSRRPAALAQAIIAARQAATA